MRNTVRFLLGNLAGFDPAADAVPPAEMVAIDRWALSARGGVARGDRRGVSQVRIPRDLPEDPQLLRRGSRRVLSRPAQGPAVHHAAEERRRAAPRRPRCSTSPRAWCAGWRRSCPSPPMRSGASCRASAARRCSSRPGMRCRSRLPRSRHRLEPVHPAQGSGGAGAREAARRGHHRRFARRRGRGVQQGRVPREAQGAWRRAALPADHLRGQGEAREQRRRTARGRHQDCRDRQGGRRVDPRAGLDGAQVRTLLAPSPGCRVESPSTRRFAGAVWTMSAGRASLGVTYE